MKLGYERSSKLYKLLKKEAKPGFDTLDDLLMAWPEVSAEWLMRGEGPMLKGGTMPAPVATSETALTEAGGWLSPERRQELLDQLTPQDAILYIPAKAQAGYSYTTDLNALLDELTSFSLPMFARGVFRAFDVSGNSMVPTFANADVVICREVLDGWRNVAPGHCYVVVMNDNVVVKRINRQVRDTDTTLVLHSDNSGYPPYEVAREDVREIWQVQAFLSRNVPSNNAQLRARLREILDAIGPDSEILREYVPEPAGGVQ